MNDTKTLADAQHQLAANHDAIKLMGKWLEDERALSDRLSACLERLAWLEDMKSRTKQKTPSPHGRNSEVSDTATPMVCDGGRWTPIQSETFPAVPSTYLFDFLDYELLLHQQN